MSDNRVEAITARNDVKPGLGSLTLSEDAPVPVDGSYRADVLPHVATTVGGGDKVRTPFTFTNIGLTPAFSITVDTVRCCGQTMDFEMIDELRPGGFLTCRSIVYPVVNNDPHWTFEFWGAQDEECAAPFTVRYLDESGGQVLIRNTLRWDGRRVRLAPDDSPERA